jgi:hypothetical protein
MVLRPNHWQIVDLGFEAQSRNSRSSSPRAWCRPHIVSPELSISRPSSTRPVRPSPILCIRSPTPSTILIAARHTTPAHHETNKHDFSNETKIKIKQPKYPGFEFKHHHVNDSSQSNQGTDHLISQRC